MLESDHQRSELDIRRPQHFRAFKRRMSNRKLHWWPIFAGGHADYNIRKAPAGRDTNVGIGSPGGTIMVNQSW